MLTLTDTIVIFYLGTLYSVFNSRIFTKDKTTVLMKQFGVVIVNYLTEKPLGLSHRTTNLLVPVDGLGLLGDFESVT